MRGIAAALLALALLPAGAGAAGPPKFQAIATLGGTLGKAKVKVISIDWVDAARHGHVAFDVITTTGQVVFEFRNSFEEPYGHVVQIGGSENHLAGWDFTDDSALAYREGSMGCDVYRSVEGLPAKLMGKACGDPAKGDPFYSSLPGAGAYFAGTYYFESSFGPTASEAHNSFVTLANGGTPAFFADACPEACRSMRVDSTGGVWAATQSDVYKVKGGKPQPYVHSLPAFVDDWGLASGQLLVRRGNGVDVYGLTDAKRESVPHGPIELLCCGNHNGSMLAKQNVLSDNMAEQLVRVQRSHKELKQTVIAKRGDHVAGAGKGAKIAAIDARYYSSPVVWDDTVVFLAQLSTGKTSLILRRPPD